MIYEDMIKECFEKVKFGVAAECVWLLDEDLGRVALVSFLED